MNPLYTLNILTVICSSLFLAESEITITECGSSTKSEALELVPLRADDEAFVLEAFEAGIMETKAAEIALKKTSTSDIKSFAEKMMKDHSKANSELGLIAKEKRIAIPTNLPEADQSKIYELENKNGSEFDNAYMDLMVADHEKAVALFETQATSGQDSKLKKWAADKLPILKHHLAMARDLAASTQKLK